MISLALGYITGRRNPKWEWYFDAIRSQNRKRVTQIIVIDYYAQVCDDWTQTDVEKRQEYLFDSAGDLWPLVKWSSPKPTIWQGPHRVTRGNHWAMSNARNTAICLCKADWLSLSDDRCALSPMWMAGIKRAIAHNYIMFGAYEKHHGLRVHNGVAVASDKHVASDNRLAVSKGKIAVANGAWGYGCTLAAPLTWLLDAGGYPEKADGLSFEDVLASMVWHRRKYPMRYDPMSMVIQDRTPSELDAPFIRNDKGEIGTPRDKSHAALEVIGAKDKCENEFDLREERERVLRGEPWRIPDRTDPRDWFDGSRISDL
jgi:hypothetical protein